MMRKYAGWFLVCFCLAAWAIQAPVLMLQSMSNQLMTTLKQNQAVFKTKPEAAYDIIHKIVVPHLALNLMAQRTVSRGAWQSATSQQRQRFIQEFTSFLTNTYATVLMKYIDKTIRFLPLRGDVRDKTYTQVDSTIQGYNGSVAHVSYYLVRENRRWKIYDFSMSGVSMMEKFRSQFATELQRSKLDKLTDKLAQRNALAR